MNDPNDWGMSAKGKHAFIPRTDTGTLDEVNECATYENLVNELRVERMAGRDVPNRRYVARLAERMRWRTRGRVW